MRADRHRPSRIPESPEREKKYSGFEQNGPSLSPPARREGHGVQKLQRIQGGPEFASRRASPMELERFRPGRLLCRRFRNAWDLPSRVNFRDSKAMSRVSMIPWVRGNRLGEKRPFAKAESTQVDGFASMRASIDFSLAEICNSCSAQNYMRDAEVLEEGERGGLGFFSGIRRLNTPSGSYAI